MQKHIEIQVGLSRFAIYFANVAFSLCTVVPVHPVSSRPYRVDKRDLRLTLKAGATWASCKSALCACQHAKYRVDRGYLQVTLKAETGTANLRVFHPVHIYHVEVGVERTTRSVNAHCVS